MLTGKMKDNVILTSSKPFLFQIQNWLTCVSEVWAPECIKAMVSGSQVTAMTGLTSFFGSKQIGVEYVLCLTCCQCMEFCRGLNLFTFKQSYTNKTLKTTVKSCTRKTILQVSGPSHPVSENVYLSIRGLW